MARTPCVRSSPLFTLWQTLKVPGSRKFGKGQGRQGVGLRPFNWELKMVVEFIAAVHNKKISPLEMDKLV